MSTTYHHLIAKHGILTAFSIARKVSSRDIKKLTDKVKKECKDKSQFNQLLQQEILNSTKYAVTKNLIPGLIIPENMESSTPAKPSFKQDEQKLLKLNYISGTIAKKFVDSKYNKDEICYIVLSLLAALGLNDQDFKDFHNKYSDTGTENPDDDSESDDEGEEPSF